MLKRPDQPPDPPSSTRSVPPERSFWELLPRRNFRRVLFLVIVFLVVLALRRSGGGSFRGLLDAMAPAPPPGTPSGSAGATPNGDRAEPPGFQHLRLAPDSKPAGGSAPP
jgi:hypothetical protein